MKTPYSPLILVAICSAILMSCWFMGLFGTKSSRQKYDNRYCPFCALNRRVRNKRGVGNYGRFGLKRYGILYSAYGFHAIRDINPQDKTHVLIITSSPFHGRNILLSRNFHIFLMNFFRIYNFQNHYRIIVNYRYKQELIHPHAHILSDRPVKGITNLDK